MSFSVYAKVFSFFCVLGLFSCNNNPYPGFAKGRNNLFYKLHHFGDSPSRVKPGDRIRLHLCLFNASGQLIFDNTKSDQPDFVIHEEGKGSVHEALQLFRSGDSATVYLTADSVYKYFFKNEFPGYVHSGEMLRMEVCLGDYIHDSRINEKDLAELKQLKKFIDDNNLNAELVGNSFYRAVLENPSAETVSPGKKIFINYTGRFLDGYEFDTTRRIGYPFDFVFGVPDQVIPGIEKGIAGFTKGSKLRLYLPSFMAFGPLGSSDRSVPPYTPVIYDIEIIDVIVDNSIASNSFEK